MADLPFNESIDKVTEQELVYDIIERMKLGRDMAYEGISYYPARFNLNEIIGELCKWAIPYYIENPNIINTEIQQLNFHKLTRGTIYIKAGETSGAISIPALQERKIAYAISRHTGFNITPCINARENEYTHELICTYVVETPHTHDDAIDIYAY